MQETSFVWSKWWWEDIPGFYLVLKGKAFYIPITTEELDFHQHCWKVLRSRMDDSRLQMDIVLVPPFFKKNILLKGVERSLCNCRCYFKFI